MSKTILITGASSGFGRDTAETLFRAGHAVYASMRSAQGKNREAAVAPAEARHRDVELDVSDDGSVEAGVNKVLAEAGTIDVLVNNAGIMSAGVTEAFTAEQPLTKMTTVSTDLTTAVAGSLATSSIVAVARLTGVRATGSARTIAIIREHLPSE